jgi:hypothetical protein
LGSENIIIRGGAAKNENKSAALRFAPKCHTPPKAKQGRKLSPNTETSGNKLREKAEHH